MRIRNLDGYGSEALGLSWGWKLVISVKRCGAVQGRRVIHSPGGQPHVKPRATEKEGVALNQGFPHADARDVPIGQAGLDVRRVDRESAPT